MLIEPMHLGPNLMQEVKLRVYAEMEGTCLGKLGYVVSVVEVNEKDIKPGFVDNDTGCVNVIVWYSAIMFRPFTNEVMDASKFQQLCVQIMSFFTLLRSCFVVVTSCSDATGFFCKVGPLVIYISKYAIPDDIEWDKIRQDCFVSTDGEIEIREGSVVRLRIMGLTLEASSISATGTIKDDYLGLWED